MLLIVLIFLMFVIVSGVSQAKAQREDWEPWWAWYPVRDSDDDVLWLQWTVRHECMPIIQFFPWSREYQYDKPTGILCFPYHDQLRKYGCLKKIFEKFDNEPVELMDGRIMSKQEYAEMIKR
jgi:hypothetical protein